MKKQAIIAACQAAMLTGERVKLDCPASIFQVVKNRLRNREGRVALEYVDLVVDRVENCIWADPVPIDESPMAVENPTQLKVGGDLDSVVRGFYVQAVQFGYFQTSEPINRRRALQCLILWNRQNVTDVTFHQFDGQNAFYRKSCGRSLKRCRIDWNRTAQNLTARTSGVLYL